MRQFATTLLACCASLRLTVFLMVLAMVLIFLGTLAQARVGIWEAIDTYFRSPIAWVDPHLLIPRELVHIPWLLPFPGGLLLGAAVAINLLAAHARSFSLRRGKIGVLVLHAGLLVLLAGEFITAFWAREGVLSLDVGATSRVVEDLRRVELAVIDPSDPEVDHVITISQGLLARARASGASIDDPRLPFALRIEHWEANARLVVNRNPPPGMRGVGREAAIDALAPVRGVDGAQSDAPAAVVAVERDGETLGRWLLWVNLIDAQAVPLDGDQHYGISLRYAREYLPYTLTLKEFRHDRFTGTQIAKNFSSRVRIDDPQQGVNREVLISMNNPLRYRGGTFYQASYMPDDRGSVLQVVHNPASMLPYIACLMVGGGMAWHFLLGAWAFAQRRQRSLAAQAQQAPALNRWQKAVPWAVGLGAILLSLSSLARPLPHSAFALQDVAHWPASAGGRVKPLDSVARHVLLVSSGRTSLRDPESGESIPPVRFLLDLMADPERIKDLPLVRVDHPDVLALLDLRAEDFGRLPLSSIEPHWQSISRQATQALDIPSKQRDSFQRAVVSLYDRVSTLLAHSQVLEPYVVAPLGPNEDWRSFQEVVMESATQVDPHLGPLSSPDDLPEHPSIVAWTTLMTAYAQDDVDTFNSMAQDYRRAVADNLPEVKRRTTLEVWFNRANLFGAAMAAYVITMLLALAALLLRLRRDSGAHSPWAEHLRRSAYGLLIATVCIHTFAIIMRMYLQGRPPVTNLYSSAVFVGWAAVLLGILLERIYPLVLAILGAAMVGFATLIVAHHLGTSGDTLHMMQAVLDSNFWLSTHVITITLGYSANFVAGALAICYVLLGVFTRALSPERGRALTRMVIGTVCFALLLSFVGTVLGGIWADQSWGRFWGWDPKENGAALVVLINAIILHARWGGMIRERGIMLLAIVGNMIIAWSWFGTNLLGVGLHSYGFMEGGALWLLLFVISQLMLISIGLIPLAGWRSRGAQALKGPPESPPDSPQPPPASGADHGS